MILAGPNGTGKSSLFDAFQVWHKANGGLGLNWDLSYYPKAGDVSAPTHNWNESIRIEFHDSVSQEQRDRRKAFSFRSAYRNDPQLDTVGLSRQQPLEDEPGFNQMIANDAAVGRNYQRLASQALEDVFVNESPLTMIGAFREKVIGDVRDAMQRIFPGLVLNGIGNPLTNGTFRFDKGTSREFLYKNLSGGEKAAFDLLLDFLIRSRSFANTIYCVDEPEAHMNSRVQAVLLGELYGCLPSDCQLWLASHSIGMMRRARDIEASNPGTVAFLDFHDIDFDEPQVLRPVRVNRAFWERVLAVALDDLSTLIAPRCIVICEVSVRATAGLT